MDALIESLLSHWVWVAVESDLLPRNHFPVALLRAFQLRRYQKKYNMAHELGHNIGFRHTNWQARGESAAATIPHTGTETTSVMNGNTATFSWTPSAHFSPGDKKAAVVLYPQTLGNSSLISVVAGPPTGLGGIRFMTINFTTDDDAGKLEVRRQNKYGFWTILHKPVGSPITDGVTSGLAPFTYKVRADNFKGDFNQAQFSNSITINL